MSEFLVVDLSPDRSMAALKDRSGALHVVRAENRTLNVHDEFNGASARLGRHWLLSRDSTRGLSVVFEQVNCGQFVALACVHSEKVGARS